MLSQRPSLVNIWMNLTTLKLVLTRMGTMMDVANDDDDDDDDEI